MCGYLPDTRLYYLDKQDLDPEKYEYILPPARAWSYIDQHYEFDDSARSAFALVHMREKRVHRSHNQSAPHGPRERERMAALLFSGEVVMLNDQYHPEGLFYIDDHGQLICRSPSEFTFSNTSRILQAYARSVSRRDYRHSGGKPRPTVDPQRRPPVIPDTPPPPPRPRPTPPPPAAEDIRQITLTLGLFFDGTGNNANHVDKMLIRCDDPPLQPADLTAQAQLAECGRQQLGVAGIEATSYTSYYTNVHWLRTLYKQYFPPESDHVQSPLYIEGIGTTTDHADSLIGQALGTWGTGVVAKTDLAVARLPQAIRRALTTVRSALGGKPFMVKALQFDLFGFSRGAAAARHFANRVRRGDRAIAGAIRAGLGAIDYSGPPGGTTRFIGIFDTVTAIGTLANGFNPNSADTGEVQIALPAGVAAQVFHLTAAHECRFNFALNSVDPHWPELALPGVHADIGGGYLPLQQEDLYLTNAYVDIVPMDQPEEPPDPDSRAYRKAIEARHSLSRLPALAPILRTRSDHLRVANWCDYLLPVNRYGKQYKRRLAALSLRQRVVKNDWSKVALRVMLAAARAAGVLFDDIDSKNPNMKLPAELIPLCDQALALGQAARSGQSIDGFRTEQIDRIAGDYLHCSAHWGTVETHANGEIKPDLLPLPEAIAFPHRPDADWQRTVHPMQGENT